MIARALAFVIAFGTLQLGWQATEGCAFQRLAINIGVVAPAAAIARLLTPGLGAYASGNHLREPSGGINIVTGCDGSETLFLLAAGLLVAPLPLGMRLRGIAVGLPVVYALNQARILSLFYAHRADPGLFNLLHGVVTPILMVLGVAAFYYLWLNRYRPPGRDVA